MQTTVSLAGLGMAGAWMIGSALLVILLHWAVWRLFFFGGADEAKDAGSWASLRVGALHGLILALAFSSVRGEYNELLETIDNEALAIEQLYRQLDNVEGQHARDVQKNIADYTRLVINEEWPSMRSGQPLESADRLVDEIYQQILELASQTEKSGLASALLDDVNDIENARGQRSFDITEPLSPMFWLIVCIGFLLTCVGFFPNRPSPSRTFYLAAFAGMNGLVIFAILSFSNPFSDGFPIAPDAHQAVLMRTIEAQN